jgi:hypothetical protein
MGREEEEEKDERISGRRIIISFEKYQHEFSVGRWD